MKISGYNLELDFPFRILLLDFWNNWMREKKYHHLA